MSVDDGGRKRRSTWVRSLLGLFMPMQDREPPALLDRQPTPLAALRVQSERCAPLLNALQDVFQDRVLSGEQSKPGVTMLTAEIEIARADAHERDGRRP